jgi:hypothetical protein
MSMLILKHFDILREPKVLCAHIHVIFIQTELLTEKKSTKQLL